MSSWSAWNVTGSLNSEILRVLMDLQTTLSILQNNAVYKDGNTVTSALRIGTNNNYDVIVESNNTDRMTIESTGNVRVHNQLEIGGTGNLPGLCASGDNSTGLWFPTNSTAAFVGNSTNLLQVSTSDVIASGGKVSLGNGGPFLNATGTEMTIDGANKDIHFHPKGSKGLMLNVSGQDLNIVTDTAGNGTTQVRINGTGTVSRPQYSFSNKTNTGVFLSNDGYLTMSQDGSQVFRCFATGVDMTADQIFFDTQSGPTYYPQICWDSTDSSRDTGLYSPGNGVLRFQNNGLDSLHVSDNILSHMRCHMNSFEGWLAVNNSYPSFGSAALYDIQFKITYSRSVGTDMQATGQGFQLSYRVGNVVHGTIQGIIGSLPQPNCNFANLTQITVEVSVPNKYGGSDFHSAVLSDGVTSTTFVSLFSAGQFFLRNPTTHEVKTFVYSEFWREDLATETFRFVYSQNPGYLWTGGATQSNNTNISFGGSFTYLVYESVDNYP